MIWPLPRSPTSFHTFSPCSLPCRHTFLRLLKHNKLIPISQPFAYIFIQVVPPVIQNFYFNSERPSPIPSLPSNFNFPQHIYHNLGHCQSPSYECKLAGEGFCQSYPPVFPRYLNSAWDIARIKY